MGILKLVHLLVTNMNYNRHYGGVVTKSRVARSCWSGATPLLMKPHSAVDSLAFGPVRRCGADLSTLSTDSELRWYLIQCKPRQDQRALENLGRQNFECYRPLRLVERCRAGRKFTAAEPLFPGYLFIRLDRLNDNWYPIRSTRGVSRIVHFNAYPLPVQDEIIDGIRARLSGPLGEEPYLKPGARVQITEGAFSQLEAIFVASDGIERVVLLLNILHTDQKLSFPLQSVRKLD